jgi:signal peptidase
VTRHSPQLIPALEIARSATRLAWVAGTVALLTLIAVPHLLPVLGRQMYVVSGGSMEPTIPLGSVVFVHQVDPTGVQPGQIITFRLANGTVVTHRVVARSEIAGATTLETKGDANSTPDITPVTGPEVVGSVEMSLPSIGSLIVNLSSTPGEVMLLFALGGLLLAGWFLEELLTTLRRQPSSHTVVRALN